MGEFGTYFNVDGFCTYLGYRDHRPVFLISIIFWREVFAEIFRAYCVDEEEEIFVSFF